MRTTLKLAAILFLVLALSNGLAQAENTDRTAKEILHPSCIEVSQ